MRHRTFEVRYTPLCLRFALRVARMTALQRFLVIMGLRT